MIVDIYTQIFPERFFQGGGCRDMASWKQL
jgi:hypothetical protein